MAVDLLLKINTSIFEIFKNYGESRCTKSSEIICKTIDVLGEKHAIIREKARHRNFHLINLLHETLLSVYQNIYQTVHFKLNFLIIIELDERKRVLYVFSLCMVI